MFRTCKLVIVVVVSHIQRIDCQPKKKLLYTVANPARGVLNREKKKKKKSGSIERIWPITELYFRQILSTDFINRFYLSVIRQGLRPSLMGPKSRILEI